MQRIPLSPESLHLRVYDLWENDWLLLTAGDFQAGKFNAMTVSWGSIGSIWGKPYAQVFVRPTRYTYEFCNQYDTFTLCAFPAQYRKALSLIGSRSGKDADKIAQAGLTPEPARLVAAPVFAEASLAIECRKIYWADLNPANFLDESIHTHYPNRDYHRTFYGEILFISATESYQSRDSK